MKASQFIAEWYGPECLQPDGCYFTEFASTEHFDSLMEAKHHAFKMANNPQSSLMACRIYCEDSEDNHLATLENILSGNKWSGWYEI